MKQFYRTIALLLVLTLGAPFASAELSVEDSLLLLEVQEKKENLSDELDAIEEALQDTEAQMDEINAEIFNVEEYLDRLEETIETTEENIEKLQKEIKTLEVEIEELEEEIEKLLKEKELLKTEISDLMALLYMKQDIYYDDGNMNLAKLLLSEDSLGEIQGDMELMNRVEAEMEGKMAELVALEEELTEKQNELKKKKEDLLDEEEQLEVEKDSLEAQKENQEELLAELNTDREALEASFEAQMSEYQSLHSEVELYASSTEKLLEGIEGIAELTEEEKAILDSIQADIMSSEDFEAAATEAQMTWDLPLHSVTSISAYFSDSDYLSFFGVPHDAVDMPTAQASSVLSVDLGVVTNVHWDGTEAYAYIQVQHPNNFSTVYGHIYLPLVEVGDVVSKGQVIGLSGATPGMTGSGPMTTGPHLHFEVLFQGEHVDPLMVLPLAEFPDGILTAVYEGLRQVQIELSALQESLAENEVE